MDGQGFRKAKNERGTMKKIPTDFEIINEIYNRYENTFHSYSTEDPDKITRVRVPIDIERIAKACGVSEDMVFGRIYYHFNKKYSYRDEDGKLITFFASAKFDGLSVNFPMVASVLADLKMEQKNFKAVNALSISSIILSVIALTVALLV